MIHILILFRLIVKQLRITSWGFAKWRKIEDESFDLNHTQKTMLCIVLYSHSINVAVIFLKWLVLKIPSALGNSLIK